MTTQNELLTSDAAADYCGLARTTLPKWRWTGKGPKYLKLGKAVRYRREDLDDFLAQCERSNTSEGAA